MMFNAPNSSRGLIIRAEKLAEEWEKTGNENYKNLAKSYIELSKKNWPPKKNKQWIKENTRGYEK